MRFSLSLPFFKRAGDPSPWQEMFDLARLADDEGYDTITIGHHHFQPGYPGDPILLMAAIAARTERIRVGTGIYQLPLHHPLRIAEQVAMVDELSGGRACIGVGLGWWPLEYEVYGVPMSERGARMDEALRIMRLAWTEESVSFEGRFWQFPELTVYPRPVTRPNPPVYVAGSVAKSVERAARLGDGWLCSPTEPVDKVVRWSGEYVKAREALGRPPTWFLRRYAWIAPTRREVEETVLPAYVEGLIDHAREGDDPAFRDMLRRLDAGEPLDVRAIADDRLLWGAPDDVVEQIMRYQSLSGCDHVHVAFAMGLPGSAAASYMAGYDETAAMLKLFAREVIPAFR
jgi:probable F420-dependent oxidoreductase